MSFLATLKLFEQDIILQQQSQWVVNGVRQFIKDSLDIITDVESYIEFAWDVARFSWEALKPFPIRDREKEQELLLEVVNPTEIMEGFNQLWEILENIDEIVEWLSEYDKVYYKTYVSLQAGIWWPFLVKKNRSGGKIMESSEDLKKVSRLNLRRKFKTWNFASWKLDKHYQDHVFSRWEDWPTNITKNEYLNRARSLLSAKPNSNIIEHVNKNGFIFKYNKITNEFATWKPDGTIETLYKPTRWYEYVKEQIIKYP